jgi:hypothetical protein
MTVDIRAEFAPSDWDGGLRRGPLSGAADGASHAEKIVRLTIRHN